MLPGKFAELGAYEKAAVIAFIDKHLEDRKKEEEKAAREAKIKRRRRR